MAPYSEDMFNLGYGSPEEPNSEVDFTKVADSLEKVENKILSSVMEGMSEVGNGLSKIDNKVTSYLQDSLTAPVESVKTVDRRLISSVAQNIESGSVKIAPLNVIASKRGDNLSQLASELLKNPADKGILDKLRTVAKQVKQVSTREKEEPSQIMGVLDGLAAAITKSNVNRSALSPNIGTGGAKPGVYPPGQIPGFIIPAINEIGIKPGDVENVIIHESGYVTIEHGGGTSTIPPADINYPPMPPPSGQPPVVTVPPGVDQLPTDFIDPVGGGMGDTIELPSGEEELEYPTDSNGETTEEGVCPSCGCPACECINESDEIFIINPGSDYPYETPEEDEEEEEEEITTSPPAPVEEEEEEEEPEPELWWAICDKVAGRVYTQRASTPIRNRRHVIVAEADTRGKAAALARGKCRVIYSPSLQTSQSVFVPLTTNLCLDTAYDPRISWRTNLSEGQLKSIFTSGVLNKYPDQIERAEEGLLSNLMEFGGNPLRYTIWKAAGAVFKWLDNSLGNALHLFGDTSVEFDELMTVRIILGFMEQWITADLTKYKQPFVYKTNEMVPTKFPSEIQAMQAYMAGDINEDTWILWTRMNDHCPEPMMKMFNYYRTKFPPTELLAQKRRGIIDWRQYRKEFRSWGYMDEDAGEKFEASNKFVPPIQDLIRFMVRDVFDTDVVNKYELSEDFTSKWVGEARKWGDYQGIDPETALKYWQAHWLIPPTGQLYDIYHREKVRPINPEKPFGIKDLSEALQIQDNNPKFIPFLIRNSQHLLTRVDVRRAYRLGILTNPQVIDNYIMRGYAEEDAEAMGKYADEDKYQFLQGRRETKLYREGVISDIDFRTAMFKYGAEPEMVERLEALTTKERTAPIQKKCLKSIEKRYIDLEITLEEATQELNELGVPEPFRTETIDGLECLNRHKSKRFTASQLCELFNNGFIDLEAFYKGLEDLEYSEEQQRILVGNCLQKALDKRIKEDRREQEKDEKERIKLAKEEERKLAKAKRTAEQLVKARQRRMQAQDRRELRLAKVITKLARCNGSPIEIAGAAVREAMESMSLMFNFTMEERTTLMERTVDKCEPKTLAEFNDEWVRLAREFSMISSEPSVAITGVAGAGAVNGLKSEGDNGTIGK